MTAASAQDIAIIGLACRLPGAHDSETFWRNLCRGVESIELAAATPSVRTGTGARRVGATARVDAIAEFDAPLFGIEPREAELMDPQHRIFLECTWEALEHAGYDPTRCGGRVGVFAGAGSNGYAMLTAASGDLERFAQHLGTGADFLATRVSYTLGLTGPSVSIQTACSTSLVAVCLGCDSLIAFGSDIVLAGGVSLPVPESDGYDYHDAGVLSPDGHCRAFDAAAAGTVPGAGVGVVVLKRFSDALAHGDRVHAVIRGWAVNNDGATKAGFAAPAISGQAEVIAEALAMAEIEARSIGYVEAHGTATALGDAVEVTALTRAFRRTTNDTAFCALGSVKGNIGHADTAAGVAGLVKATYAVERGLLPGTVHFATPNPKLQLATSPFFVHADCRAWRTAFPRRAGVSSFGIGGTNAHVILEQAAVDEPRRTPPSPQLLVLSARTASALDAATNRLGAHLRDTPDIDLADAAYTCQAGRRTFTHRRAIVAADREAAVRALMGARDASWRDRVEPEVSRPVAFMFPGQGSLRPGVTCGLYRDEQVFRARIADCADALQPLGYDLLDVLFGDGLNKWTERTDLAQPATLAVEMALAALWESWGVTPTAMIGQSVGEYAAATLAGVFSLQDALSLMATRGQLMQACAPGAMTAVRCPEDRIVALLGDRLSLAAVNGPDECVIAGSRPDISALERELDARRMPHRRLAVARAFHSDSMEACVPAFEAAVARVALHPPATPFVSSVTGVWISEAEATSPTYWARHLRETTRFAAGLTTLTAGSSAALLEIGLHALASHARRSVGRESAVPIVSTLGTGSAHDGGPAILCALGDLWLAGVAIDWSRSGERRGRRVPLPTYPFEGQRYWPERRATLDQREGSVASGWTCTMRSGWRFQRGTPRRGRLRLAFRRHARGCSSPTPTPTATTCRSRS